MMQQQTTDQPAGNQAHQAARYHHAAVFRLSQAEFALAEQLLWQALEWRTKAFGPTDPLVVETLQALCAALDGQGKLDEAREVANLILSIREQTLGESDPVLAADIDRIARLFDLSGDSERAEQLYEKAFSLRDKHLRESHPELSASLADLAVACERLGKLDKAESGYRRLLSITEQCYGEEHPKTVDVLERLLNVLTRLRGRAGLQPHTRKWADMAVLYHGERRYAEAAIYYRRAIERLDGCDSELSAHAAETDEPVELSDAESAALRLAVDGFSLKEIAERLLAERGSQTEAPEALSETREQNRRSSERVLRLLRKATE